MKIQASAEAMVRSKSFASLRHRPSHAKVRSTTQRRGKTSKPLALSVRLTISSVNFPTFWGRNKSCSEGVVTLFEMWPREADTALFRQAVHSRLPTRPWLGVDGFEFVLRSGWSGMGRRDFGRRRRSTRNAAMSRPTGNPVAFVPVFGTAGENSPSGCSSLYASGVPRSA